MAENLNLAKLLALLTDMTAAKVILLDTAAVQTVRQAPQETDSERQAILP